MSYAEVQPAFGEAKATQQIAHYHTHLLEFGVLRITRERNHVPDIGHAGDEQQKAFKAESETAVRCGTETAGIEIPPIGLFGHVQLVDAVQQLV